MLDVHESQGGTSTQGVRAEADAVRAAFSSFSLPRLTRFSGDKHDDEDGVEQFLREFERHV